MQQLSSLGLVLEQLLPEPPVAIFDEVEFLAEFLVAGLEQPVVLADLIILGAVVGFNLVEQLLILVGFGLQPNNLVHDQDEVVPQQGHLIRN